VRIRVPPCDSGPPRRRAVIVSCSVSARASELSEPGNRKNALVAFNLLIELCRARPGHCLLSREPLDDWSASAPAVRSIYLRWGRE